VSASLAADDRTLRLERSFRAPPARLFAAWTEPGQLARWFLPRESTMEHCRIDLRVGGDWEIAVAGAPRGLAVSGRYLEVDPPHRLSFTWAWHEDGTLATPREHETVITLDFHATSEGTRLELLQTRFRDPTGASNHREGWTVLFGLLESVLADDAAAPRAANRRGGTP